MFRTTRRFSYMDVKLFNFKKIRCLLQASLEKFYCYWCARVYYKLASVCVFDLMVMATTVMWLIGGQI